MRRIVFTLYAMGLAVGAGRSHGGEAGRIAFVSGRDGNAEIYVMNGDGSNQTNLTRNPARDLSPAWSPDRTNIAFLSDREGNPAIFVMNADGTKPTNLTGKLNLTRSARPAWSPDGTKIAFVADLEGSPVVYTMNADGTGQTNLTADTKIYKYTETAWSPDGTRILSNGTIMNEGDVIYVVMANGSGAINFSALVPFDVPAGSGRDGLPAWFPDGTKISFPSMRGSAAYKSVLYLVDSDGTDPVQLTDPDSTIIFTHAWSSDGKKVAYLTNLHQGDVMVSDLHVRNADGTKPVNLTKGAGNLRGFAWSPDGAKIALELATGSQVKVTQEKAVSGAVVMKTQSGGGKRDIYIVNADGTKLVPLTDDGKNMMPVWCPGPLRQKTEPGKRVK